MLFQKTLWFSKEDKSERAHMARMLHIDLITDMLNKSFCFINPLKKDMAMQGRDCRFVARNSLRQIDA